MTKLPIAKIYRVTYDPKHPWWVIAKLQISRCNYQYGWEIDIVIWRLWIAVAWWRMKGVSDDE